MSMSALQAFLHTSGIKSKFKVISTIEGKRQRFIWEFESGIYGVEKYISIEILSHKDKNHTYIEDRESNKSLKCFHYTIELPAKDGKNKVTGYYIDQFGNIKSKNIKFNLMEKALKAQDIDLEEYLFKGVYLETITTSLGYDLDGLPDSCQKGKGEFFKIIDPFTQMYLLKYGDTIKARCYVWNEGSITFKDEDEETTNTTKLADRIYAVDGYWRDEMIKRLKEEGIDLIWSKEQDEIYLEEDYKAYIDVYEIRKTVNIHIEKNKVPWLDTFNQYSSDTYRLYLYDWKSCGYISSENQFDISLANYIFLTQDGKAMDLIFDNFTGELIPYDDAVYVSLGDWTGNTACENAVWSEYHSGYILEKNSYAMIVGDEVDYTYRGSGETLVDINGEAYLVSELECHDSGLDYSELDYYHP